MGAHRTLLRQQYNPSHRRTIGEKYKPFRRCTAPTSFTTLDQHGNIILHERRYHYTKGLRCKRA